MHTHLFLKAEKEALKIRNTFDRIISIWTLGMLPAQTLQSLTLLWQLGDTIFVLKLLHIHLIFFVKQPWFKDLYWVKVRNCYGMLLCITFYTLSTNVWHLNKSGQPIAMCTNEETRLFIATLTKFQIMINDEWRNRLETSSKKHYISVSQLWETANHWSYSEFCGWPPLRRQNY